MGADEQEDDPGGSEVLEDVWLPFVSGDEIAVKPVAYDVLVSQIAQVDGQFIAEFAVFVGIGDKDIERHALLLSEWNYVAVFIIPRNAAIVTKGSLHAKQTWGEDACHTSAQRRVWLGGCEILRCAQDDRWWKKPLVIPRKSARDPSPSFLRASAHTLSMTGEGRNSG